MNVRRQKATDEEVAVALYDLDGAPKKVRAADWPSDLENLSEPGLYSWWVDEPGAKDLTDGLRHAIQAGRIYVGQTGATYWPSGKIPSATLRSRISQNHLRGRISSSTFRLTLAAALAQSLGLKPVGPKQLTLESEARLACWIQSHLEVAVHRFTERDALDDLEGRVLDQLDPPLNLDGRAPSSLRTALADLRQNLATTVHTLASRAERQLRRNSVARE